MKKFLLGFILLVTNSFLHAASVTSALLDELNAIHSMTASFIQIPAGNSAAFRKDVQGTLVLQKPGKFRWDIDKPSKQLLVTDGHTLWIDDVELKQVTIQPLTSKNGGTPLQLLSGDAKGLLQRFRITAIQGNGTCFDLKSLQRAEQFQRVQLCFDQHKLISLNMTDNLNHSSLIRFAHVSVNTPINQAVFHFNVPAGVDVIRRR